MGKRSIVTILIPLVLVPTFIFLLNLLGFLDMGARLLFSFGMICYFVGYVAGSWQDH